MDALWIAQKIECGELIASQHMLHRLLSETNLRLYRELRLRRQLPLPSFGLGRRIETLAVPEELASLRVEANLDAGSLLAATQNSLAGLESLMRELLPGWSVTPAMRQLLLRLMVVRPAP